jgi:hypothetical protein
MRYADRRLAQIKSGSEPRQTAPKSTLLIGISLNKKPSQTTDERREWYRNYSKVRRKTPAGRAELMRSNLKATHGLTLEHYTQLFEQQLGRCAICRREITRGYDAAREPSAKRGPPKGCGYIDHDHRCCTGRRSCGQCVRGLLCHKCNFGLSGFRDDPALLRAAAVYLERRADQSISSART